mmetsp:Transcript_82435/g.215144  ORF Transcript_82435/g.215144 Transcript_82435/m.215144 type:complete len:245 (-) Transcript_82435:257-991(-)
MVPTTDCRHLLESRRSCSICVVSMLLFERARCEMPSTNSSWSISPELSVSRNSKRSASASGMTRSRMSRGRVFFWNCQSLSSLMEMFPFPDSSIARKTSSICGCTFFSLFLIMTCCISVSSLEHSMACSTITAVTRFINAMVNKVNTSPKYTSSRASVLMRGPYISPMESASENCSSVSMDIGKLENRSLTISAVSALSMSRSFFLIKYTLMHANTNVNARSKNIADNTVLNDPSTPLTSFHRS